MCCFIQYIVLYASFCAPYVFFKGNPKDIKKEYPKIEYTEEDMVQFEATETSSESETTENE